METYRRETQLIIKRFLNRRLGFPQCVAALDAALADLIQRISGQKIAPLRALILTNNEVVMKEMERRGPQPFDPKILAPLAGGVKLIECRRGSVIYEQGVSGEALYYIQKGRVKLTAVSKFGKQAVIGVLGAGSFFGEGCLRGLPYATTATAIVKSLIERLDKVVVLRVLGENLAFSELFLAHLLSRNISMEQDMVYQILNSNEKRLARALLLLANFGKKGKPKSVIPKIKFEDLAQMVGTTISRVSFYMKKFRKLGFIDYNGEFRINNSLLNVVLHDQFVSMANDPIPLTLSTRRMV